MDSIYSNFNGLLPDKSILDTVNFAASLAPAFKYESPLQNLITSVGGFSYDFKSAMPWGRISNIAWAQSLAESFAPLTTYNEIVNITGVNLSKNALEPLASTLNSGFAKGFSATAASLASNWLKDSGYTAQKSATDNLLPAMELIKEARKTSLLGLAVDFFEQIDDATRTEIEKSTEEFLDDHPEVAKQIINSPDIVSLSLRDRRIVSTFLGLVICLTFASFVAHGEAMHPDIMRALHYFGINLAPLGAGVATYKGSMKLQTKYLTDKEANEELD